MAKRARAVSGAWPTWGLDPLTFDPTAHPGSDATPAGGSELFLRQVPANTVERVPVQGVTSGAKLTFKAVTVDGSRTYGSRDVTLTGLYAWSVP